MPLVHAFLDHSCYFEDADFLCSAQRRRTASAMRLRPSGVRFRFFFADLFAAATGADFFVFTELPRRTARARCNCAISRSICARISETPTVPPRAFDQWSNVRGVRLIRLSPG